MQALKDAVVKVFFKTTDMRNLLIRSDVSNTLISEQDWSKYKFHVISPIIDHLNKSKDGIAPLRNVLKETLGYTDCSHLLWMKDGKIKREQAEASVIVLRKLVKEHDIEIKKKEIEAKQREAKIAEAKRGSHFQSKLEQLKIRFYEFHASDDRRKSGYGLEAILYDLFNLFELDPKSSFRRVGEQIDGDFVHTGDQFLLEAKWQAKQPNLADLRDLDGAVNSSLDNTLGLFISINGFSPEAITSYVQGNRPKIICMDGLDLVIVLEGNFDLVDLIKRKRDVASSKRLVFVQASEFLKGSY